MLGEASEVGIRSTKEVSSSVYSENGVGFVEREGDATRVSSQKKTEMLSVCERKDERHTTGVSHNRL